jgi:uncharacterized phiE125 gp8 family phage protein
MTPPVRVAGPAGPVVSTAALRAHLRVDGSHDDATIAALHDAAVAYLDGPRGILGRCIRPQTWQVTVTGPGPHLLPMPDVTSVIATAGGDPAGAEVMHSARGSYVTLPSVETEAVLTFVCGMPEDLQPVAEAVVKLLVGHWYEHREAVAASAMAEVPLAVDMLIGAIRWRLV